MPEGPTDKPDTGLLCADEPSPFVVVNPLADRPLLLVCDHASCRFPQRLGDLGLDPFARRCHLAIDIGAGRLTELLAESLSVTAVLQQYSRLIIDCNRELLDPGAFLEFGDGIVVPGNRNLSRSEKDARADAIYHPYHAAIDEQIKRLRALGPPPAFISVHSFTPVLDGVARRWQVGVLWDKDERLAEIFIEGFRAAGYETGDNEPYSGKAPQDYTIDHHAEPLGLPHVGIEIRQDLIDSDAGAAQVAAVMHDIIDAIPKRVGLLSERIPA
ncbi:MAG: N-formylglutamate amidohydrolase [Gammaproteobacteria bacterium]|nr:N-formylglutamate amidohydrolase [Gammaproteobacteria bacterium]